MRSYFEPRFGLGFGGVHVHADTEGALSAKALNARAYTIGKDIVFGQGQYAPETNDGKQLLAHELTHVVQQAYGLETSQTAIPRIHRQGTRVIQRQIIDTATCDSEQADAFREAHQDAIHWIEYAINRLGDPQSVRNLLNTHFRLQPADDGVAEVLRNLRMIQSALVENTNTYHCEPDATCRTVIGRDTNDNPIYRGGHAGAHDITFCANMFDGDGEDRTRLLVHETAHTNPANLPDGPYRRESGYPGSTPLTNAEAYSEFVEDLSSFRMVALMALMGGFAAPFQGEMTWQARFYTGIEFEHPVLGIFNPTLGIGLGVIGETTIPGAPGEPPITSGTSFLTSLLAGLRITAPRDDGTGGYVSFFGGPALAVTSGELDVGAEAGIGLGYRWRVLDLSTGVGYTYDPTREAGMEHLVTLSIGASIPLE